MAGIRVSPSNTKDRSCKRPCQVAGVERRVGSVVKAIPMRARPARERSRVPINAGRTEGRLRRRPDAKMIIMDPLRRKVAVMIHPYSPSANPLGQSKVGARSGCHPSESRKSYLRIVRVVRTTPKKNGPIIPASAASLIHHAALTWKEIRGSAPANRAMLEHIRSCAAR